MICGLRRAWLLVALGGVLATAGLGGTTSTASAATDPPSCSAEYRIDVAMANGARWQMCWEIRALAGLVLSDVTYTPNLGMPTRVLASASLAEVAVPYDSGQPRYYDVSELGFGGEFLMPLAAGDCPGGERRTDNGIPVLCVQDQPRGYAYTSALEHSSLQGHDLVIFAVSEVGWYDYITEWRFSDDGSITPREGATGSLSPFDFTDATSGWPTGVGARRFSENHSHNVFWRLDFDVDGQPANIVQQYDFSGSGTPERTMRSADLTTETGTDLEPMRWWRVTNPVALNTDAHQKSWEIDVRDSDQYRGPSPVEDFTRHDVYVTQYQPCEELANGNPAEGCATSLDQYVNSEAVTDPVVWVSVDYHHVPRDEDQDPMPTHWQGFRIVPRDVTATSQLP